MPDTKSYAVFLFPQALEALGAAITPYLSDAPAGKHIVCANIDSSGAYFEMTLLGADAKGQPAELELRIPHAMVKLIVSLHDDHPFGFQAHKD